LNNNEDYNEKSHEFLAKLIKELNVFKSNDHENSVLKPAADKIFRSIETYPNPPDMNISGFRAKITKKHLKKFL